VPPTSASRHTPRITKGAIHSKNTAPRRWRATLRRCPHQIALRRPNHSAWKATRRRCPNLTTRPHPNPVRPLRNQWKPMEG
jgi:hypothetical protein